MRLGKAPPIRNAPGKGRFVVVLLPHARQKLPRGGFKTPGPWFPIAQSHPFGGEKDEQEGNDGKAAQKMQLHSYCRFQVTPKQKPLP
jgi:hypothetical protein